MRWVGCGMREEMDSRRRRLVETLCLGVLVTLAFYGVPYWIYRITWRQLGGGLFPPAWMAWYYHLLFLAFALVLTAGSWRRSGLRIGAIRTHWRKVLLFCGLPILLTAVVYPLLPTRPFGREHMGIWLISPLAQDLVFPGYLYGRLEPLLPSRLHRRVPIRRALVVTSALFSLWHLPNLLAIPAGFVAFQLCYTFLGGILVGLTRQWTGSMLYITLSHMAVNFIAWSAS